ncbi:hypothetical protein [Gordonia sp. UCD-TK1]|uniref:hypothetical protein n=1 Tax=Gordonia sp. UCD-TK1 TaxID=1857893 RepID=UPI00080DDE68|nr:hypothetical protein [Gordonia sp. UCD-TK1]OCH81025.1 hypothetical protein A9310_19900 [Gordonia sp. UCD-TK1]
MTPQEIREVCSQQAVVDLRFALAATGIGEATGYRMAKHCAHELPFRVLRVGWIYKVPTASLLEALGLSPLDEAGRQLTA